MARHKPTNKFKLLIVIILLIAIYILWCIYRPLPSLRPKTYKIETKRNSSSIEWPKAEQSSIGFLNSEYLESNGDQLPAPIASVAKLITALVVLEKKPLNPGEQGSTITLSAKDEELFKKYQANDGSVVPTAAGEKITEYQVLQAMMLPSSNNLSDSLAIWAYGSLEDYANAANSYLKRNGLTETKVGTDASGLNPSTKSTSKDLIKLGKLAMKNLVLKEIVSQPTATGIPLTNGVKNVNYLLGKNGIVGIKTGNSDEAGGAFLSASIISPNQKPITIITAVAKADNLYSALQGSLGLIKSAQGSFKPFTVVKKDQIVGKYNVPWGGEVKAKAQKNLTIYSYQKIQPEYGIFLEPIKPNSISGYKAGEIVLKKSFQNDQQTVPIKIDSSVPNPSLKWRLTHPF